MAVNNKITNLDISFDTRIEFIGFTSNGLSESLHMPAPYYIN